MNGIDWIIIMVFAIVVIGRLVQAKELQKDVAATLQRVRSEFNCDELYVAGSRPIKCIGVDFNDRRIVLGTQTYSIHAYDFSQITAVELVENDLTLTQTSRGSQLLGAAVGGAILGGVGAVIGGLSGSSRSRSRVRSLYLKVTIDDRALPIWLINFSADGSKKGADPDDDSVKRARIKLERMYAHVRNAIHQTQTAQQLTAARPRFSADELRKLWDLKQAGILTENEYEDQKALMIGANGHVTSSSGNQLLVDTTSSPELES